MFCPFCIATAAIVAGSATGTGGVAAVVAGKLLRTKARKEIPETPNPEEVEHGDRDNGSEASEGCSPQRMD